ncbi:MAG: triosephosphate isomerase [Deltaproteobacteria bacterium]|nr:triosephosphate isomerase [Deltaproteobacteria bacterium]
MTIEEGRTFVGRFLEQIDDLADRADIVLCPPYTALYPLSLAIGHTSLELGAQNLWAGSGTAHTGEVSSRLLMDAGCRWVILGHWEVRRRTGDTDTEVNGKMHSALEAGLRPILMIGEDRGQRGQAERVLANRLPLFLAKGAPEQVARSVVVYEPEWTIGAPEPASPDDISSACAFIREWIRREYGRDAATQVRIIYGGGVSPEFTRDLLTSPDVDGLGAGRKGRDPVAFARIVRTLVYSKTGSPTNTRSP